MYIIKKIWSSDITELISKHASLDKQEISLSDNIVYKVKSELIIKLNDDKSNLNQLKIRWPTKTVYLLTFSNDFFQLYIVEDEKLTEVTNEKKSLSQIRNHDLNQLIIGRTSDCAIKAPYGGHFVTPSGKHTKIFIRIGDAINSFNSMDRISFWLQEVITNDISGIVVDTPSLLSVVVHTLNLKGKTIPFTCLRESAVGSGLSNKSDSILRKFSTRVEGKGKVLILISMSVSGTTEEAIIDRVKASGIQNDIFSVSIFGLKDTDVTKICALDIGLDWYASKEVCEYCNNSVDNKIYEIDGKTFFPKISQQKTVFLMEKHVKKSDANGIDKFYKKYGSHPNVFRFHYSDKDDPYNSRHHAFYVHVLSLLDNNDFITELNNKIIEIISDRGEIDLVIHPPHAVARKIVDIVKLTHNFDIIESSSLDPATLKDTSLLLNSKHILVLDDVFITGGRQKNYLENIRKIFTNKKYVLQNLTFFPLITRVDKPEKLVFLKRSLQKHDWKNHYETLYSFLLPLWGAEHCPWCNEKKLLVTCTSDPIDSDDWLQNRLDLLDNFSEQDISENPLLYFDSNKRQIMSAASPIVDPGYPEQVVLFVLASAVQELRNDKNNPLGNDLLYSHLLCIDSLVQFSDQLIQTCLLRLTTPDEWTNEFYDKLFEDGVYEVFNGSDPSLLPEVLIRAFFAIGNRELSGKFFEPYKDFLSIASVNQLVEKLKTKV